MKRISERFLIFLLINVGAHLSLVNDIIEGFTDSSDLTFALLLGTIALMILYFIRPILYLKIEDRRIRILMGGRRLIMFSIVSTVFALYIYLGLLNFMLSHGIEKYEIISDAIFFFLYMGLAYVNGFLRVMITSRRMTLIQRIYYGLTFFIPIVSFINALWMCHQAKVEFEHETYKAGMDHWRVGSKMCATKYPVVLLHGVGFKDFEYFNYWGRIPKYLVYHGAKIFYGHQEAWGTIENNAQQVKDKILQIIEETGCEKVNIIAHSKGGLDARYMISQLNMGIYVASLTTISTPHRGSELMDFIYRWPKGIIEFAGGVINGYCRLVGDPNPDFHGASQQFLTRNAKAFNEEVKDAIGIYYQSYISSMRFFISDYILAIPYIVMHFMIGENDGLVSIDSSKWGQFRGVMKSYGLRGISHGDIIDLRRNEYTGFDVREFYVTLVSDLKEKGY